MRTSILKPTHIKRFMFFVILDILISMITLFISYNLRFSFEIPKEFFNTFFSIFIVLTIYKISFLSFFNIYKVAWRYFTLGEARKLFLSHCFAYFAFFITFVTFNDIFLPFARSILLIDFFLSLTFIGVLRISKRLLIENSQHNYNNPTMIIGANGFSQTFIKYQKDHKIIAIVDDNKMIIDSYFSGIKVKSLNDIEDIIKENGKLCVIIAKDYDKTILNEIFEKLRANNITDIKIHSISKRDGLKQLSVEDLLARHPKDLDKTAIHKFIKNKIVLITGAGGSIGSEISRQCVNFGAKELILLDHSEYNLYKIAEELCIYKPKTIMQSVVNKNLLEKTFEKYKPDIVIHAAAYKHVPLVEENITEGILNNIIGTKNTIDCAIKYKVSKFILISTDKAVRPTNVMGTTKRICELYAQNVSSYETEVVAVRFGNVLGSSGSVIPKFKAQISNGGPITVTHPEITRYFMLIPEACELVLQAGSIGKGGEIFILDMGKPIKIVDLAKKMIELSGRDDIEIKFTGLRTGEKLYEELLINDTDMKTLYESITVAGKTAYDIVKLNYDIQDLLSSKNKLEKLKEIVPEFIHMKN